MKRRKHELVFLAGWMVVLVGVSIISLHTGKSAAVEEARVLATQWALVSQILLAILHMSVLFGPWGDRMLPRSNAVRLLACMLAAGCTLVFAAIGLAADLRPLAASVGIGALVALGVALLFSFAVQLAQARVPSFAGKASVPSAYLGALAMVCYCAIGWSRAWLLENDVQGPAFLLRPVAQVLTSERSPWGPALILALAAIVAGAMSRLVRVPKVRA
jgi:hypothetical protein